MKVIETALGFSSAFLGILSLVLIFFASVVALFKIDEADHYFGEWESPEQLYLKGLPFSLWRMTHYGVSILFKGRRVIRHLNIKGKEGVINQAPVRVRRLLVWLYAGWMITALLGIIMGYAYMWLSKL